MSQLSQHVKTHKGGLVPPAFHKNYINIHQNNSMSFKNIILFFLFPPPSPHLLDYIIHMRKVWKIYALNLSFPLQRQLISRLLDEILLSAVVCS